MSGEHPVEDRDHPGFSISVPGNWIILDLEALGDQETAETLVAERIEDGTLAEESRDEAIEIVERATRMAHDTGVRFASVLLATDADGPIVASVMVASAWLEVPALDQMADPAEPGPEVKLRSVQDDAPADSTDGDAPDGAFASSSTHVVLPAGPAARVERHFTRALTDSVAQEAYAVQYVLPANHRGLTITITCVSPAVRLKADLDRVFEEIAQTLKLSPVAEQ